MTHFDFLPANRRAAFVRAVGMSLNREALLPIVFVAMTLLGIWLAAWIERVNLRRVEERLNVAQGQMQELNRRVTVTQASYVHLQRMITLERRFLAHDASGARLARRYARLANDLPREVYLRSIRTQHQDMVLRGSAQGYPALGASISGTMLALDTENVRLASAQVQSGILAKNVIQFELHAALP